MRQVKLKQKAKVFDHPFLEWLTKTSPTLVSSYFVLLSAAVVASGFLLGYTFEPMKAAAYFVGGIVFWTIFEYALHRFIFHYKSDADWAKKMHHYAHGIHHDHPNDTEKLFMPIPVSTGIAIVFFIFFALLFDKYVFWIHPAFMLSYLMYAMLHFAIHAYAPPKSETLRALWKHHHLHHHQYDDLAFGVSSRFWDRVFATMPPLRKNSAKKRA